VVPEKPKSLQVMAEIGFNQVGVVGLGVRTWFE
jgi:hypothetical protein